MAIARTDELDRLKGFCQSVVEAMLPQQESGASLRDEMTAAIVGCRSVRGARLLVRDLVEWSQDLRGPGLAQLDAALAAASLPTLSLVRSKESAELAGILTRGIIANEDECRFVIARLADTASNLSETDRELADQLLARFGM